MRIAIDAHTIGRRVTGNEVDIRSLWNAFADRNRQLRDSGTSPATEESTAHGHGRALPSRADRCHVGRLLALRSLQEQTWIDFGLLTHRRVIMVRYTGKINAHRH